MDSVIKGTGVNDNIEAQVDFTHQALRVSSRPLDHQDNAGNIGGHFMAALIGGALPGLLTAPVIVQSTMWIDSKFLFVLKRYVIKILCTAFSAGTSIDFALYKATKFTVANSTGAGRVNISNPSSMYSRKMSASLISAGEMSIAGTTALSGGNQTLDSSPLAAGFFQFTAAQQQQEIELYNMNKNGQHPQILQNKEGLILRVEDLNLPASNTIKIIAQIEWAEVPSY